MQDVFSVLDFLFIQFYLQKNIAQNIWSWQHISAHSTFWKDLILSWKQWLTLGPAWFSRPQFQAVSLCFFTVKQPPGAGCYFLYSFEISQSQGPSYHNILQLMLSNMTHHLKTFEQSLFRAFCLFLRQNLKLSLLKERTHQLHRSYAELYKSHTLDLSQILFFISSTIIYVYYGNV